MAKKKMMYPCTLCGRKKCLEQMSKEKKRKVCIQCDLVNATRSGKINYGKVFSNPSEAKRADEDHKVQKQLEANNRAREIAFKSQEALEKKDKSTRLQK